MKTEACQSIDCKSALIEVGTPYTEHTPRSVVKLGVCFVPRTLRYLGVPEVDVMDAAQDVFVVALRRFDDFEGRSSITTWLYSICIRVAHGYRRKNRNSRELLVDKLPEMTAPAQQEAAVEQSECRRALSTLLGQLEESQRAAFVLYENERLSMKEVANVLGCTVQTAYSRHNSARTRLLKGFGRYAEEREQ